MLPSNSNPSNFHISDSVPLKPIYDNPAENTNVTSLKTANQQSFATIIYVKWFLLCLPVSTNEVLIFTTLRIIIAVLDYTLFNSALKLTLAHKNVEMKWKYTILYTYPVQQTVTKAYLYWRRKLRQTKEIHSICVAMLLVVVLPPIPKPHRMYCTLER